MMIGGPESSEPVKAGVVGNATLETKVTVSPSPDLLAKIDQRMQNGSDRAARRRAGRADQPGDQCRKQPRRCE